MKAFTCLWSASPFSARFLMFAGKIKEELKMGKSMYNFGKQGKEKARQQKQIDKASKRIMTKQRKGDIRTKTPPADPDVAEPEAEVLP